MQTLSEADIITFKALIEPTNPYEKRLAHYFKEHITEFSSLDKCEINFYDPLDGVMKEFTIFSFASLSLNQAFVFIIEKFAEWGLINHHFQHLSLDKIKQFQNNHLKLQNYFESLNSLYMHEILEYQLKDSEQFSPKLKI